MAVASNILPVYLAVGEDDLKQSEVLKRLRARLEKADDLSFDYDEFRGESATGADIVSSCETAPFLAAQRLVVVKQFDKLKKADLDDLAAYVKSPCDTCILLLMGEKLLKTSKLYKSVSALDKKAVIDCALPKGRELQKKIVSMAASHGVRMTDSAASLLLDYVGPDTVFLDNEIAKMALACADTGLLSDAAVREYVESSAEAKPWQFLEPFSQRNIAASLQWLGSAKGVSAYALVPMCATRLKELICAKTLGQKGQSDRLAAELGLTEKQSWKVKNHIRYARNFTEEELRHALYTLRDAEQKMKSADNADETFMLWVVQALAR